MTHTTDTHTAHVRVELEQVTRAYRDAKRNADNADATLKSARARLVEMFGAYNVQSVETDGDIVSITPTSVRAFDVRALADALTLSDLLALVAVSAREYDNARKRGTITDALDAHTVTTTNGAPRVTVRANTFGAIADAI
jgi:hypothetical protein